MAYRPPAPEADTLRQGANAAAHWALFGWFIMELWTGWTFEEGHLVSDKEVE